MQSLSNKNIIIGVTGGIAAFKAAGLVSALKRARANVRVIMTSAAKEFVTELTFQALSGHAVHADLLDTDAENVMGHIKLARWADVILVAPATANFISRLSQGKADDLLSAVCLTSEANLAIAPAMNSKMYENPKTSCNLKTLQKDGVLIFGPADGLQACGETGPGRMLEPENLILNLAEIFKKDVLSGKKILITAGPTRESLDPVRFISNRSSGKMGYALAEAAVEMGAKVELISGPVCLGVPDKVDITKIERASQMLQVVMDKVTESDWLIGAAAVADYAPLAVATQKIKKSENEYSIKMQRNPDIIKTVGELKSRPFLVGFAAETKKLVANAKVKLANKNLDVIVANEVGEKLGVETDDNAVTIFWQGGKKSIKRMRKTALARKILEVLAKIETDAKHTT